MHRIRGVNTRARGLFRAGQFQTARRSHSAIGAITSPGKRSGTNQTWARDGAILDRRHSPLDNPMRRSSIPQKEFAAVSAARRALAS
jgi:hypothetical protein